MPFRTRVPERPWHLKFSPNPRFFVDSPLSTVYKRWNEIAGALLTSGVRGHQAMPVSPVHFCQPGVAFPPWNGSRAPATGWKHFLLITGSHAETGPAMDLEPEDGMWLSAAQGRGARRICA